MAYGLGSIAVGIALAFFLRFRGAPFFVHSTSKDQGSS
jgi:hypothetical protein